MSINFGLAGAVRVRLRRHKSGTTLKEWKMRNVLTNGLLDLIGTSATGLATPWSSGYIACGTGTTAPVATQTALVAEIAPASTNRSNTDNTTQSAYGYNAGANPDYCFYNLVRDFTTTQANGAIGELGVFTASTGGTMYARCLPKDVNGNTTVINKTSATTMEILWQLRVQPIQGDVADSVVINGTTYTLLYRACNVNATVGVTMARTMVLGLTWGASPVLAGATMVARTASPAPSATPNASTISPYVNGNFYRDVQANFAATSAVAFVASGAPFSPDSHATIQVGFTPVLPALQTATFRIAWTAQ